MAEDKAARSARNRRYYVKRMEQAQQPEPPREHVKIGPNALGATGRRAASSEKGGPYNPFQPYAPAPGVVPKGHDMAMDAMDWGANDMPLSWAQQGVMGAAYTEGMEFLGYPQLAAMAQRSEYRVISETLAEEMTRRWIKFEATGDSDDGDSDASLDKDDQNKLDPDQQDGDDDQEEDAEQDDDEKTLGQDAFPQQAAPPAQKPAQPGQPAPPPAGPPAGLVNPANPTQPAAPKPPDPEKKARDAKQDKITKIEAEFRRLQVRDRFKEIAEHDGFFGRSHLYIDTGAGDDADELASNMGDGRDDISKSKIQKGIKLGLRVIEPVWTYPTRYESSDPLSPRWYKPDGWLVMGKTVHSSRLLTFVGREVPDLLKPAYSFGGLALTQMAKPYVENWLKVRTGVTKAVTAFSVFVLGTDQNMMLAPDSDEIFKRATLFNSLRDNNGLMMIDKETETFANVSMSIAGLEGLQAQAQEHMACLKGDTLIETARGQIAIKDVTTGDRVMTRNGYAPVAWAGVTKYASRMVRIETDDSVVLCTEEHPIWVESENRFVLAENVNLSHRLRKSPAWENTACLSHGAVIYGAPRKQAISAILKQGVCSIASITRRILDQSQTALMSITAAAIRAIYPNLRLSIAGNITPVTSRKGSFEALIENSNFSASSAGVTTPPHGLTALYTALEYVDREHGEKETRVIDVRVVNCEVQPVYDITVADGHLPEFYANGVLVHNSVCKIPLVKLLGISPTGLNASSEGEMRCFNDSIHAYQERFFRPNLERLLGFVQLALFGEVDPEITFEFEHLYEPTDMERAEIRKTDVEADQILVDLGVLSPLEVRTRIASDDDSPYAGLSDDEEDLPDLSQEEQQGLVPGKGAAGAGGAAGGPKPPGATPPNPMAGIMGAATASAPKQPPAAQPPGAK